MLGHYTWSRNIDYTGTYYPRERPIFAYGPADNNRAHAITIASLYELPYGRGRKFGNNISKPVDWILGGWQTNGI